MEELRGNGKENSSAIVNLMDELTLEKQVVNLLLLLVQQTDPTP